MASRIDKLTQGKTPAEKFASMETGAQKENYLNFLRSRGESGPVINAMRSIAPEKPLVPDQIITKDGQKFDPFKGLRDIANRNRVLSEKKERLPARLPPEFKQPNMPIAKPHDLHSPIRHGQSDRQPSPNFEINNLTRSIQDQAGKILNTIQARGDVLFTKAEQAASRPAQMITTTRTDHGLLGSRTITESHPQHRTVVANLNIHAILPTAHIEQTTFTSHHDVSAQASQGAGTGHAQFEVHDGQSFQHISFDINAGGFDDNSSLTISFDD